MRHWPQFSGKVEAEAPIRGAAWWQLAVMKSGSSRSSSSSSSSVLAFRTVELPPHYIDSVCLPFPFSQFGSLSELMMVMVMVMMMMIVRLVI